MVRHCSYCKQPEHNRSNCSVLAEDTRRLYNEKTFEYNELPLNTRLNTIKPTYQSCRGTLLSDRMVQHREEQREERRNRRIEIERVRREESRLRYERSREQREILNNLVLTSVENHLINMNANDASTTVNTLQHYLQYNNFRNQLLTASLRISSTNNQVKTVKSIETPIETTECPICYEEFTKTNKIITSCGHQYHSTCLFKHLQGKNTCPCCRGVLL